MSNIYFYKMTADNGGAPCVWRQVLSLAICKPSIRRSASEGNLIFGFEANSLGENNGLVYAARVTEKVVDGRYYRDSRFQNRPDCIYRWTGRSFERKPSARFHPDPRSLAHDLGRAPRYQSAVVIISDDFRYFGGNAYDYRERFPLVYQAVHILNQGHRVRHRMPLRSELEALWEWSKRRYPKRKNGQPHDNDLMKNCRETDGEGRC